MESFASSTISNPPLRSLASLASSAVKVAAVVATLLATTAAAQGPQEWIKRIFDPAKVGVTVPPDATMNRKLTVDYLSKTDPPKEIAIYMMPLAQLKSASDHFKKTLHADPAVTGSGQFEIHRFDITTGKAKGLTITLTRSQFVDDKLQITMEYLPPK
jgi:hypothetical protein